MGNWRLEIEYALGTVNLASESNDDAVHLTTISQNNSAEQAAASGFSWDSRNIYSCK